MGDGNPCPGDESPRGRRDVGKMIMTNVALHIDLLPEDLRVMVPVDGATLPCERYSVRSRPDISTNMGDENPCPGDESPRGRRDVGMMFGLPTN